MSLTIQPRRVRRRAVVRLLAPLREVRWGGLLLGVLLLVGLTGCMTGDGVHAAFTREFARDPAVVDLDLSSADNMPFTGGVGGEVTLRSDLGEAELRAFAERVREFGADHGGAATDQAGSSDPSRVRITLLLDEWRLPVLMDPEAGNALLEVFGELRGDARVQTGGFGTRDFTDSATSARLEVADGETAFALLAESPELFAGLGRMPEVTVATVPGVPERVVLTGAPGAWSDRAGAGYAALGAAAPLTAFEADPAAVTVTLASEADLARAEGVARGTLRYGDGGSVYFQSDLVTLFPGASGGSARVLLADLPVDASAGIESLWTDDHALQLGAPGARELAVIAAAVDQSPAAAGLGPVTIRVGPADEPTLAIEGAPGALAERAATVLALGERGEVARVVLSPGFSSELETRGDPSDADLAAYARQLKPHAEPGDRVCIDAARRGSFCVTAAERLTAAELTEGAARDGRAFVDAWNAQT
ncbi:hypothetical protein [Leucobacter chromiireducens]|uniref:Uncharacterized protein n=1 Tax=Leucobacter chromiireducens subsp. solipictus TaxID=398235 RepID=A0ABS1SEC9_9MICO|nr:hypothetical protein [Leucobacter chromiireducens]MBL3678908.1 hypothetical protein [Leucobacter chromiireducens subsp. solipictus]